MRLFYLFIFALSSLWGCTQEPQWRYIPQVNTIGLPLGDTILAVLSYQYDTSGFPFFVHLHHNEATADSAMHFYMGQNGGRSISIQNSRQRLIRFPIGSRRYLLDPNRVFTPKGIRQTLQLLSSYNAAAARSALQFSDSLLRLLPAQGPVIAVHNNTDGAYSLLSYYKGGTLATEAEAVFRNANMDPDDFVLTSNPALFQRLKELALNAVLQHNEKAADDGSLGYRLGNTGRVYVNIEAQHGHFTEQIQMIQTVIGVLNAYPLQAPATPQ